MIGEGHSLKFLRIRTILIIATFVFLGLVNSSCGSVLVQNTLPPGRIIFITGSCSAGKTSMARIIAQKLNAKSFAFDEYVMPIVFKKFIKKHYGKFLGFFINKLIARNFSTAVNLVSEKRKYKFQIKFYNDLRQGLADQPTKRMYREVKKVALQGQNVVVESSLYLGNGVNFLNSLTEFDGVDVIYVLAYCPWNDLIDRIKKRNLSSNKKTHREFSWALGNFIHNFEILNNRCDKQFLECLRGKDVHRIITEYAQPKYKKGRLHVLPEMQRIVLQAFAKDTYYYIYPRFEYNVIVDTKIHNPEQGAKVVLDNIQNISIKE